MSSLSDYAETAWLNHLLRNTAYTPAATVYVELYTVAPTDAGGGTPVSGSGYARKAATFSAASGRAVTTSADITWTPSGGNYGTIVAIGIFDALTAGNLLAWDTVTNKVVNDGETYTLAAGQVTVSITTGSITNYAVHAMLNLMFRNVAYTSPTTVYTALYGTNNSDSAEGTELTSQGSYARQATAFDAPSGGVCANTDTKNFLASGADFSATITAIGITDNATIATGNLLWYDNDFDEGDATITNGDTFQVLAGSMTWAVT